MKEGFDRASLEGAKAGYVHKTAARFQDVDAAGVVFFARIFDYFHDAYLAFMESAGHPHADVIRAGEWGVPLRRAEADFMFPIRFGDALDVALVKAAWEGSKLTVGYRLTLPNAGGRVAAVGITHHLAVALPKMTRIDPPVAIRELFQSIEEVKP